jgi:hypothetical protein
MEGAVVGTGEAQEFTKEVNFTIDGNTYTGSYVFSSWSHTGKMIATSASGGTVMCDFVFQDFRGMGTCDGKDGKKYAVEIFN